MSKSTKIVFALVALLVVLIMGGSLAGNVLLAAGLNNKESQLVGAQNASDRLLRQYTSVYNQYTSVTDGKIPLGSTPEQAAKDAHSIANAGAQGPQGPNGRGIQNITCQADGKWKIVYTDNTSVSVAGPCRVVKD